MMPLCVTAHRGLRNNHNTRFPCKVGSIPALHSGVYESRFHTDDLYLVSAADNTEVSVSNYFNDKYSIKKRHTDRQTMYVRLTKTYYQRG